MITLTEFKGALAYLAKPNRFMVTINPPSLYDHGLDLREMRFFIQAAVIPAKTIGEVIVKFHGMELRLPGDSSHDDLTLTFLNHHDWAPRDFFENWSHLMQDITSAGFNGEGYNIRTDAIDLIKDASIQIDQIGNTEDEILASYKFSHVFPKNVGEIELNMETIDTVETFQVTFAYSHQEQV